MRWVCALNFVLSSPSVMVSGLFTSPSIADRPAVGIFGGFRRDLPLLRMKNLLIGVVSSFEQMLGRLRHQWPVADDDQFVLARKFEKLRALLGAGGCGRGSRPALPCANAAGIKPPGMFS